MCIVVNMSLKRRHIERFNAKRRQDQKYEECERAHVRLRLSPRISPWSYPCAFVSLEGFLASEMEQDRVGEGVRKVLILVLNSCTALL